MESAQTWPTFKTRISLVTKQTISQLERDKETPSISVREPSRSNKARPSAQPPSRPRRAFPIGRRRRYVGQSSPSVRSERSCDRVVAPCTSAFPLSVPRAAFPPRRHRETIMNYIDYLIEAAELLERRQTGRLSVRDRLCLRWSAVRDDSSVSLLFVFCRGRARLCVDLAGQDGSQRCGEEAEDEKISGKQVTGPVVGWQVRVRISNSCSVGIGAFKCGARDQPLYRKL